jgi:Lon protease-like protein
MSVDRLGVVTLDRIKRKQARAADLIAKGKEIPWAQQADLVAALARLITAYEAADQRIRNAEWVLEGQRRGPG